MALSAMRRHELPDEQWAKVKPLVHRYGRPSKLGERNFVNAVVYGMKTGTPWRDLPERFADSKSVYHRFANWSRADHFERILKALRIEVDETGSLVDATVAWAHQDACDGKGGSSSKVRVVHVVDSPRNSARSWTSTSNPSTSS